MAVMQQLDKLFKFKCVHIFFSQKKYIFSNNCLFLFQSASRPSRCNAPPHARPTNMTTKTKTRKTKKRLRLLRPQVEQRDVSFLVQPPPKKHPQRELSPLEELLLLLPNLRRRRIPLLWWLQEVPCVHLEKKCNM